MKTEPYKPVSCDYHDQLEAAAMHKTEVDLELEEGGSSRTARGRIVDVFTADGAEYVNFVSEGRTRKIRLDQIVGFKETKV